MNSPPDAFDETCSTTEPAAFLNGKFVPFSQAKLPLYDAGLVQGVCVTDFIRTFRRQLYLLREHLDRFCTSCRLAEIPLASSINDLNRIAEELVARNAQIVKPSEELALILIATPGAIPFYAGDPSAALVPTLAMHTVPLDFLRFQTHFKQGVKLATPRVRAVPGECIDPRIKHRSRLHWWLAQQEVNRRHRGALALLLDHKGFVTETAAANFLLVRDDTVLSPPLDTVLNGISLIQVRRLCLEMGFDFQERPLTLRDCELAQEAFLTNTSFCLAGVRSINGVDLNWPGPLSEQILSAWSQKIGIDIRQQFLAGQ